MVRGPIVEGLPPEQIAQLQAQELPPQVTGAGRRVAVYTGGMASAGLLKALRGAPGITAYPLYRLRPEHWKGAQVLILPQLNDVAELTPEVIEALRGWVAEGGVLLLTHDSVGFRWHPRLFPEIGHGTLLSQQRKVRVLAGRGGATAATFEHAYSDHVVLQPADGATVVAVEAANGDETAPSAPVVIAGRYGKGRVIMNGSLFGYAPTGAMPEGERQLLLELVSNP
jgi:hypothetical protein